MKEQQQRIEEAIFELKNLKTKANVIVVLNSRCSEENYKDGRCHGSYYKSLVKAGGCNENDVVIEITEPETKEHYDEIAEVLARAYDVISDVEKVIEHNESHPNWWTALNYKMRTK